MFTPRVLFAIMKRPDLWVTAMGAWFAFTRRKWWKRPPFLPIPDAEVLRWRVTTAYGQPDMTLAADDVIAYLQWRKWAT